MSGDPDFDDFLERRRPLFRRDVDDGLEPPAELDRIVLRQAREAIREERPLRLFNMPRWAAPVAIAATLVLGLSIVFKTGMRAPERVPEVRVESIAQRMDYPAEQAPATVTIPAEPASDGTVMVDLVPPRGAGSMVSPAARPEAPTNAANSPAIAGGIPAWRRDSRTWLAEIQRLRASGDKARADAEQAEFNREYRAYAGSPDR